MNSESAGTPSAIRKNSGYDIGTPERILGVVREIPSAANGRSFPTLFVVPNGADEAAQKTLDLVFLLHGKNEMEVTEAGLRAMYAKARLQEIADLFQVIIVAPIVGNTFYLDSPVFPEMRYGTLLSEELPAAVDAYFQRSTTREQRILCGFSMGGYGAVSTLFRAPDVFSVALSRAGAADLATGVLDLGRDDTNAQESLGSYWKNAKAYHDTSCLTLLKGLEGRQDIAVVLEVGVEDFLLRTNRKLRENLVESKVPHIYSEVPGGHRFGPDVLISLLAALQNVRPTLPFLKTQP